MLKSKSKEVKLIENERLTWKELSQRYPKQYVGLKDVIWNDRQTIESAVVAYEGVPVSELVTIMQNKDRNITIAYMGEPSVHRGHKDPQTKAYSSHFASEPINELIKIAEILYDREAAVFIAVNEEIGLFLEKSSYDQLVNRIKVAVPEMAEENGIGYYSNIFEEVA